MNGKEIYQSDTEYLLAKYDECVRVQQNDDGGDYSKSSNNDNTDRLERKLACMKEDNYRRTRTKNEGTALVLSLILGLLGIMGVGHIYIRKIGQGIGLLILGFVLVIVGAATLYWSGWGVILLIVYFILFVWQVINARDLCKKYNMFLLKTVKEMW